VSRMHVSWMHGDRRGRDRDAPVRMRARTNGVGRSGRPSMRGDRSPGASTRRAAHDHGRGARVPASPVADEVGRPTQRKGRTGHDGRCRTGAWAPVEQQGVAPVRTSPAGAVAAASTLSGGNDHDR
jgi:hypothetical protein